MARYSEMSPWGKTRIVNKDYLNVLEIRPVPKSDDDVLYEIQPQFTHRPDLLAYSVYGSSKLWWVFAQRNPDSIEDPVYDFAPGVKIRLPKLSNLKSDLGI